MTKQGTKTSQGPASGTSANGSQPRDRSAPAWRAVVNRVDRLVSPRADAAVRTNAFADSMAMATRLEIQVRRRLERQSTWIMHKVNLPTAGDIRRVQAQLSAVEARLRDVHERMDDDGVR